MPGSASDAPWLTVLWTFDPEPETAERLLLEAAGMSDRVPSPVRLAHLCAFCGSSEHGRPILTAGRSPMPHVSISRAGAMTVVAASEAGPVGVDVEVEGAADFVGFERIALHPAELPTADSTVVWVRKESVLKATGHGLRVEPSRIRVTAPEETAALVEWDGPGPKPMAWMYDVRTAPGYVAAVTVLAAQRPRLVVREGRGAPAPRATT